MAPVFESIEILNDDDTLSSNKQLEDKTAPRDKIRTRINGQDKKWDYFGLFV